MFKLNWSKFPILASLDLGYHVHPPLFMLSPQLPVNISFIFLEPFAKASWVIPNSHTLPCVGKGNPKVSKKIQPLFLPLCYLFNTYISYIMAELIDSSLITFHFGPWCLLRDEGPPSYRFWNPCVLVHDFQPSILTKLPSMFSL
jgi:hypothetical protein